ncbi:hypothetical protein PROFUN_13105 [Planoprotostelium fungivorum]|uniref:Catalase core domain-containing protein n=1 Tax=Planoprotostelium fungivorum TaxID=1890364 RepID=A0A2P6N5C4_9EUKA|nr:hypothetical protein PROFUN_13105 [Planoprotostelium fungivorum]
MTRIIFLLAILCISYASIIGDTVDKTHAPKGRDHYIRWNDSRVEPPVAHEEAKIDEIVQVMNKIVQRHLHKHRHAFRGTHVKTQGIVKGSLRVSDDLPDHLSQGLFATPKTYDVILRYASEPIHIDDDRNRAPRGLGMKVFDVTGRHLHPSGNETRTHDFAFNSAPTLELTDLPTALDIFKLRETHYDNPTELRAALALRSDRVKQSAPYTSPLMHVLSLTFFSQSAFRYGDNVVKFGLFSSSQRQREVSLKEIRSAEDISESLREYFRNDSAHYDLKVQMIENIAEQPVEDASAMWNWQKYPWQTVATLELPSGQDSFSPQRRTFWEDKMKLNVWHGLEEHKPLGSINRLRKRVYEMSSQFREENNATPIEKVSSIDQIP